MRKGVVSPVDGTLRIKSLLIIESIKLDVGQSNSSEMSAIGGSSESPILTKLGDNHQDNHEKFNGNDLFYAEKS